MRNIYFDGRLGADAQLMHSKDGKPFIKFSVANNIYSAGQEKTEWFDVTCSNEYFVSRVDKYKKGTFVTVTGQIISEVNVVNGRVFLNHHVRAFYIDRPSVGKKEENDATNQGEVQVSTYTGSTPSVARQTVEEPRMNIPVQEPEPAYSVSIEGGGDSDDLPF